ncbi:ABC transporter [Streptomyces sp. NBC_00582]|uniref:ABC transporter n=1 Tax=Streptomyces sp. NBC_00582 TaxID=2975783 RepID=UPI001063B73C|nr:ABC transporter [Streptomyces sp. NBC_00582]WUB61256.1 ABC transporter [Streptomyces sp. NBC_00582]
MTALLRYQTALLLRSQRWLPPFLLYVVFLGVGVQGGQPLLDSLGWTSAVLLPTAAWLVRICVTGEPPAARTVVAAAAGPARAHLAAVLTALGAATLLGTVATAAVVLVSDPVGADHQRRIPVPEATAAGLLTALICALLGTAVGALTAWPVLRSTGRAVPALLLATLLALVTSGSPAHAAVTGLVTGSRSATVGLPLLPLAAAVVATAAAIAAACALTSRRSP